MNYSTVAEMIGLVRPKVNCNKLENKPNNVQQLSRPRRKRKQTHYPLTDICNNFPLKTQEIAKSYTDELTSNVQMEDLFYYQIDGMTNDISYYYSADWRRAVIGEKIFSARGTIQFTEQEEQEIMQRISIYLNSTVPDHRFCVMPPGTVGNPQAECNSCSCLSKPTSYNSYTISDQSYTFNKENDFKLVFPQGTHLLKPSGKLVELVALAIEGSPDGVLQVQQVYVYLMRRYPYFSFMDKLSASSWRSSIRHALYQKWFKKIAISDDKISNKGCFWALSKEHKPREWTLPPMPHTSGFPWTHQVTGDLFFYPREDYSTSVMSPNPFKTPAAYKTYGNTEQNYQTYDQTMTPRATLHEIQNINWNTVHENRPS